MWFRSDDTATHHGRLLVPFFFLFLVTVPSTFSVDAYASHPESCFLSRSARLPLECWLHGPKRRGGRWSERRLPHRSHHSQLSLDGNTRLSDTEAFLTQNVNRALMDNVSILVQEQCCGSVRDVEMPKFTQGKNLVALCTFAKPNGLLRHAHTALPTRPSPHLFRLTGLPWCSSHSHVEIVTPLELQVSWLPSPDIYSRQKPRVKSTPVATSRASWRKIKFVSDLLSAKMRVGE